MDTAVDLCFPSDRSRQQTNTTNRSDAKKGCFGATIPEHGSERWMRQLNTTTHSTFGGKYSEYEHNRIYDVDPDEVAQQQQQQGGAGQVRVCLSVCVFCVECFVVVG